MGKQVLNKKLGALNIIELSVDTSLLEPFVNQYRKGLSPQDYCTVSPGWSSDIKWISNNSLSSYKQFLNLFSQLELEKISKDIITHERRIMLYSGFYVTRSKCEAPNYHVDWSEKSANNAFTLICPLIQPEDGLNLLYKDINGREKQYTYQIGKAIIFGHRFIHSTSIGHSSSESVLLSMTFGTDIMDLWAPISETAGSQGKLVRLPNGLFASKEFP